MEKTKIITLEGLRAYTQKYPQPDFKQTNPNAKNYIHRDRTILENQYTEIRPNFDKHTPNISGRPVATIQIVNSNLADFTKPYYSYCYVDIQTKLIPTGTKLVIKKYNRDSSTGEYIPENSSQEVSYEENKELLMKAHWQVRHRDRITKKWITSSPITGWYVYLPITMGATTDLTDETITEVVQIKIPKEKSIEYLDYAYIPDLKKCMERIELLEQRNAELIDKISSMDKIIESFHPEYDSKKGEIKTATLKSPENEEEIQKIIAVAQNSLNNSGFADQIVETADIMEMKITGLVDDAMDYIDNWLTDTKMGKCIMSIVHGTFSITDIQIDFDMPDSMSDGWLTMSANVNGVYLEETVTGWETLDMALRAVVSAICKKAGAALIKWVVDLF
jgi:hypothetical protein